MPRFVDHQIVDFEQLQHTRTWVSHLLTKYAGIYISESEGSITIWLLDPVVLTQFPGDVAQRVAQSIDDVTNEVLNETDVLIELMDTFGGCTIEPYTMNHIHDLVTAQITHAMGERGLQQRLESALIYTLYDVANQLTEPIH